MEVSKVSAETPEECLKILQDYLPNEFGSLTIQDIEVTIQQGGLINTLKLITRKSDNYKVLIRIYGGNVLDTEIFRALKSPLSWQLLLFAELSKKGIGPKLLGVFDEGRIEEYIPSHTLLPEEFEDYEILKDIAINTAMIHSIELPLGQIPRDIHAAFGFMYRKYLEIYTPNSFVEKYREQFIECGANIELFEQIANVKWIEESEKVKSIMETFEKRIGLLLFDNNFRNVLVRENPKVGQLKVCLVDYECCRYDNPVNEIAARIVAQTINFGGEGNQKSTGYKILEESKRRFYIEEYLKEIERQKIVGQNLIGQEKIESKSIDQWMKEVDYAILRNLMNFCMMPFALEFFLQQDASFVVSMHKLW